MSRIEIEMSWNPDEFGFLHGEVRQGISVMPFRIMPPVRLWRGKMMHPECEPFDMYWQVVVDNLLTVVEQYEELGKTLMSLLDGYQKARDAGQSLASWTKKEAGIGTDKPEGSRRSAPPVDDPQQRSERWRSELPFLAAQYPELAPLAQELGVLKDDSDDGGTKH